jgi:mono/diheme cytochrome c family protein/rhodanese-related sulfurtransferase
MDGDMTHRTIAALSPLMLALWLCQACDPKATGTRTAASPPGVAPRHDEAPVAKPPTEEQRVALGEQLYVRYCKLCHGENGAGYAADNAGQLGNPLFVASATWDLVWYGIKYGRPGTPMAAFGKSQGGPLEDEQIKNLVKYIRNLKYYQRDHPASDAPVGDGGRGSGLYGSHCAACHGPRGEGSKAGPSLGNPYFLVSATDSFLTYAIKYGRPATPMKPYAGALSDQQVADIVALIRSWARNVDYGPVEGEPIPPLSKLVINPDGPIAKLAPTAGHYVPAEQVSNALKAGARMVILDARVTSDWMNSHIPGAYPAPFYDGLPADLVKALPRSGTPIVLYCGCPHTASDEVAVLLEKAGFTNIFVIEEGVLVWAQRGYPLTIGKTTRP